MINVTYLIEKKNLTELKTIINLPSLAFQVIPHVLKCSPKNMFSSRHNRGYVIYTMFSKYRVVLFFF